MPKLADFGAKTTPFQPLITLINHLKQTGYSLSIHRKILVAVVLIFAILFLTTGFVSNAIITNSFLELEQEEMSTSLQRVVNALQNAEASLETTTYEYSSWDEAKAFAVGENEDFVEENLVEENAEFLDVNLILLHDVAGTPIAEINIDFDSGEAILLSDELNRLLEPSGLLVTHPDELSQYSGFIGLDEGALLLVSHPILDSKDRPPVSGSFIFGRLFNAERVEALGEQLEQDIVLLPVDSPDLPQEVLPTLQSGDEESRYFLSRMTDEQIQGYALIEDMFGEPIYLIQLTHGRPFYQRGQQILRVLWGMLFVTVLAISVGLFVLLESMVGRRLDRLNTEVNSIWTETSGLKFVTESADDEISSLSRSINAMLRRLQENKDENLELEVALNEAAETTRLKSEFLSMMSHELRTPMNAIIGYTEMVIEDLDTEFDHENAKTMLKNIRFSSHHLLAMINEILEISKIESGYFELDHEYFNLDHLLENLEYQMNALAAGKELDIQIEIEDDVPRSLVGDENRLNQILTNLLANGVKFTSSGFVKMSVTHTDSMFRFVVADSGIGIPQSAIDYIFLEFRQADSSFNRSYEGSGLGLAIVKKLVEVSRGTISVESQEGVGSTFTVELPFALADEPDQI